MRRKSSARYARYTPATRVPTGSGASMPSCAASGTPSTANASSGSCASTGSRAVFCGAASAPPSRTGSHHRHRTSSNAARQLNEKWCGDITYVQVGGAWLYLACVIDICSRRVLGWSMASHMRAELVIDALKMAVAARGGNVGGVIFHADRGAQYTAAVFAQVCDGFGIRRSMGRVGSSYDNALAESFWQGLKRETCTTGFSRRCARRGWRSSSGSRTTTHAGATVLSTTSRPWSSNSSTYEQLNSQSRHEPLCPHSGGRLSH